MGMAPAQRGMCRAPQPPLPRHSVRGGSGWSHQKAGVVIEAQSYLVGSK